MTELTRSDRKTLAGNRDLKLQAMYMYFSEGFYPTEIADALEIDIDELGFYIFGADRSGTSKRCWHYKKQINNPAKHLSTYVNVKPHLLKKTESRILDKINKALEDIDGSDDPLNVKDLKDLTDAMEKIDKIGRLEDGKATSHVVSERATFSLRDIVAKKEEKADIPEATYREIEDESED